MPDQSTWDRVGELFAAAIDLPPAGRAAFVEARTADAPAVRAQVLELLASHDEMGDFLAAPALDFRGQLFGPYRAGDEIGRGGMSVVYRGHRVDGVVEKEGAIKVILAQSPAPIEKSETTILAALDHPDICRLIDAGATPLGFRYLVMELVEGEPLNGRRRPESDALALFTRICAAVQHAHGSLIVHRDLKPENILVTPSAAPRILDFGIAKILDPDPDAGQTQGLRAFTPDYASPEQILGHPVTTAADVYSLGAVLCELLTGHPPRPLAGLPVAELAAAVDREVTPLPIPGDLGRIVAKALRLDPSERYESAAALGRDVERYRRNEPVAARPPSPGYLFRKFVDRHRVPVTAAALAAAALAVTAGVAFHQARVAAQRFEQVRSLGNTVLYEIHDAVAPIPGSAKARQIILDRAEGYVKALSADPDVQTEAAATRARLHSLKTRP